jgi:Type IX secretion system protein PorV
MKRTTRVVLGGLLCTILGSPAAFSQTEPINVVTSAVPFLRVSPDARAGGMGDVGVATTADANSQFFNVAKYPFMQTKGGISATYTPWLKDLGLNDVYMITLAGYYKLDDIQALSASMRYFSLGDIQFTDAFGQDLNTGRPREISFDLGYSRKLGDKLALGVALRYIRSDLANGLSSNGVTYKPGQSVAGDIGLYHNPAGANGAGWHWGVSLTNLGSKISYTTDATQKDYIPANLGLGIGHTFIFQEVHRLTPYFDINKLMVPTPPEFSDDDDIAEEQLAEYRSYGVVNSWFRSFTDAPGGFSEELKEYQLSLGAEYWYNNQFSVRSGYSYEHETKGGRQFFTVGAGVRYNVFEMNFSYLIPTGSGVTRNPLSNTLRFSLIIDFGGENAVAEQAE